MADKTGISWTDATWNPVRGCSRVSEGCRNCYAERVAARFSGPGQPYHGFAQAVAPRDLLDRVGGRRNGWTRKVALVVDRLADPLRWKKPRRVFVNSMSDLFHESLTNEQIAAVFGVMAACPQHTFQVLTKRATRMREWFEWMDTEENFSPNVTMHVEACEHDAIGDDEDDAIAERIMDAEWPLPNVWLGVSVENQDAADKRIPELLDTPAAVRFLSCEPLLGAVDLARWMWPLHWHWDGKYKTPEEALAAGAFAKRKRQALVSADARFLDWIIAGCESGPGARPCSVEWLRSLRDQCAAAGVAFYLKQAEESVDDDNLDGTLDAPIECMPEGAPVIAISKRKGRGPEGNQIIELPHLDGVQHAAFPEVTRG